MSKIFKNIVFTSKTKQTHHHLTKLSVHTFWLTKRFKSKIEYRLKQIPVQQIKVWKDAQARKLDREGIAELAKSIRAEGLQNPPLVQKEGRSTYMLMAGQRRLAALKRLRAKKIPVLVITKNTQYDLHDAKAASVIENIHRKNMNQKELANSCVFLAEQLKSQSKAARTLGMSIATFKKLHGFAGVPEKLKNLVPKLISRDDATKLHIALPNINKAILVANRISKYDSPTRKQYIKILANNPKMSHAAILKRVKKIKTKQKIPIVLSKRQSTFLAKQSERKDMNPDELAQKIVSDWIKKRI